MRRGEVSSDVSSPLHFFLFVSFCSTENPQKDEGTRRPLSLGKYAEPSGFGFEDYCSAVRATRNGAAWAMEDT